MTALALSRPGRALAAARLDPAHAMLGAGYQPDGWQTELIRSALVDRQVLVCTSRQSGKTTALAALIAAVLARYGGTRVLVLAPSQRQSTLLLERVSEFLAPFGIRAVRSSRSEIELRTGSVAYAVPASSATIRGYHSIDLLVLDEAAWIPESSYAAVRPMTATRGGHIIAASTPGGTRGWYYQAWQTRGTWTRVSVPCTRVHRLDSAFLREEARAVPPSVFRSEYMCSFEESSDTLFHADLLKRAHVVDSAADAGAGDEEALSYAEWLRHQDQERAA